MRSQLEERMVTVVCQLSPGEVVSFADIAARAGRPRAARAAGRVLSQVDGSKVPWWRVVYSDGRLPPCNPEVQASRLRSEGVTLKGNRVIEAPTGRFET